MAERNGKAERNGDKARNGMAERNGDKTRNGKAERNGDKTRNGMAERNGDKTRNWDKINDNIRHVILFDITKHAQSYKFMTFNQRHLVARVARKSIYEYIFKNSPQI